MLGPRKQNLLDTWLKFLKLYHPKNHEISKLVVWRSQRPAIGEYNNPWGKKNNWSNERIQYMVYWHDSHLILLPGDFRPLTYTNSCSREIAGLVRGYGAHHCP